LFRKTLLTTFVCGLFLAGTSAFAQDAGKSQTHSAAKSEAPPLKPPSGARGAPDKAVQQQAADVLKRAGVAEPKPADSSKNMLSEGTVTVYTAGGAKTFAVTLAQSGQYGTQRIFLKQSDGKFWDGNVLHLEAGARQALEFLETQHARGAGFLLDSPNREATIADNGTDNTLRSLTVNEKGGDSTKYVLDSATSRLTQFQFDQGTTRTLGKPVMPVVHSYAFSDVRTADGVETPFHIEHVVDGVKQEELQLSKVNQSSPEIKVPAGFNGGRK
jgi:hypothetical protein